MKNKFKTSFIFLSLIFSPSVWAMGAPKKETLNRDYYVDAARYLGEKGGVTAESLIRLDESLAQLKSEVIFNPHAIDCLSYFDDTVEARSATLDCVASFGREALSPDLMNGLMELRFEKVKAEPTLEVNQSLAVIAYLDDLVRQNLIDQGGNPHWYLRDQGFIDGHSFFNFEFQNGDVVLGLGNTSISSQISQGSYPASRYSHAFMVLVDENKKLSTVEALIQTGVRQFPKKHFEKDPYNTLTVLRWKNSLERDAYARSAAAWALKKAKEKTSYDEEINIEDDDKLFCSELVIKAYAQAADMRFDELIPHISSFRSEKVYDYMKRMGVENRLLAPPGDILGSKEFEVVAEYRNSDELLRAWSLYLMGDLFFDKMENEDFKVKPYLSYSILPSFVWLIQSIPNLFGADLYLVPEAVTPYSVSIMYTVEKNIFNEAIKKLEKRFAGKSIVQYSPLQMRAHLSEIVEHSKKIAKVFKPKSKMTTQEIKELDNLMNNSEKVILR